MEDMKPLNIKIPSSLYERLKRQAEQEWSPMAAVARRAIHEYCGRFEEPTGPERKAVRATAAE